MQLQFNQLHGQLLLGGDRKVSCFALSKQTVKVKLKASIILGFYFLLSVRPSSRALVEVRACLCHPLHFHSTGNGTDWQEGWHWRFHIVACRILFPLDSRLFGQTSGGMPTALPTTCSVTWPTNSLRYERWPAKVWFYEPRRPIRLPVLDQRNAVGASVGTKGRACHPQFHSFSRHIDTSQRRGRQPG